METDLKVFVIQYIYTENSDLLFVKKSETLAIQHTDKNTAISLLITLLDQAERQIIKVLEINEYSLYEPEF